MKKFFLALALVAVFGVASASAATDYDFSGTMRYHNDVLRFDFSVSTAGTRTFFTSSWVAGNFDPMLGLWTAAGNLIEFQDDGHVVGSTQSNGVTYNHGDWDSYYSVDLNPGSYFLTLTTYNSFNKGQNFADGFSLDGQTPILITEWNQPPTGSNGYRGNAFAFHILNVDQATGPGPEPSAVPEPGTALLLGLGTLALAGFGRRMR